MCITLVLQPEHTAARSDYKPSNQSSSNFCLSIVRYPTSSVFLFFLEKGRVAEVNLASGRNLERCNCLSLGLTTSGHHYFATK